MADIKKSMVAQLLFAVDSKVDFGRITSELEGVLSCQRVYVVKAASETANIVVFSMTECCVLLSLSQVSGNGFGSCLCVSVGPSDRSESDRQDEQLELLCSRLVERIQNRYGSVAVVWRHVLGTVNAELVNALNERLPGISPFLLPIDSLIDSIAISDRTKAAMLGEKATSFKSNERINREVTLRKARAVPAAEPSMIQQSREKTPEINTSYASFKQDGIDPELEARISRVRIALYPMKSASRHPIDIDTSSPRRLTALAFDTTLLLACFPFGAAVNSHAILNGIDHHFSVRVTAITGTFLVMTQPHVFQFIASF